MRKTLFIIFALCMALNLTVSAQTDPSLFTVSGTPVSLSEFKYIYSKTNGAKADYSRASVEEYLDLYTKFKMKVARARAMQLDTSPILQEELAGYRRQLADSYLTDREVTDKLIKEAYDRMLKDINVAHILVIIKDPNDTLAAYSRIKTAIVRLERGESFQALAGELSEDQYSKANGGAIGFMTAMLPDGFYDLENAIYNTPAGKNSGIVRSPLGYHIIKNVGERSARGEIEAAHILIRKKNGEVPVLNAKARIDSIYGALKAGAPFDQLAQKTSEDGSSAARGGYLQPFGIGRYEAAFEDAAFGIERDGDYTQPFETSIGWHIVKRGSRKGIETYDVMKTRLKARIQRDGRFELAKTAMVARIKKEGNMVENKAAFTQLIPRFDSTLLTYSWQEPTLSGDETLVSFGGNVASKTSDFMKFVGENANKRVNYALLEKTNVAAVAQRLFGDFINEKALAYEELQLERKYPDFKNLMREYEEGILLFEAIKINVWDKAAQDSTGLEKFYSSNKDKYFFGERAQLIYYSLADSSGLDVEKVAKYAKKNTPQAVMKKFNPAGKELVSFREETIERGKGKIIDPSMWKKGMVVTNKANDPRNFTKVERLLPKTAKTLKEARGFVVADYQEFLEKQWLTELAKVYKVEVDRSVLESIIQK
jgi:peptidyl-prolyl cis-trans isomerase SurA